MGIFSNYSITYTFDGFPASVVRAANITIANTSLINVGYLSNIKCAPQFLTIRGNLDLISLSGINAWPAYPTDPTAASLKTLVMAENPKLLQQGYVQLGPVLQCNATGNGTSPAIVTVSVSTSTCGSFSNVTTLCSFIAGTVANCTSRQRAARFPALATVAPQPAAAAMLPLYRQP